MTSPREGRQAVKLTGRRHSLERDSQAISYHYDLSNDFFALFLDPRLVYTAPYFKTPADTLAAAQEQKLDLVCRKLDLKRGERLLDIGCGWGGLVTFAAEHYGVEAYGVTLSKAQAEFAQEQIRKRGLGPVAGSITATTARCRTPRATIRSPRSKFWSTWARRCIRSISTRSTSSCDPAAGC